MANQYLKPVVLSEDGLKHEEIPDGAYLTPESIPVSADDGNQLEVKDDGLYVGDMAASQELYVSAGNGSDDTGDGTINKPYETLAKAMSMLSVGTYGNVIYLKAGEYTLPSAEYYNTGVKITCADAYDDKETYEAVAEQWNAAYEDDSGRVWQEFVANKVELPVVTADLTATTSIIDTTYSGVTGPVMHAGSLVLELVEVKSVKESAIDTSLWTNGYKYLGVLNDYPLSFTGTYELNFCQLSLGYVPLFSQSLMGGELNVSVNRSRVSVISDTDGSFIDGASQDAPHVLVSVSADVAVPDGYSVTYNDNEYTPVDTSGALEKIKNGTTGGLYYEGMPVTIEASYLYPELSVGS